MHCDVMWCPLMWWAVICCEVMRCNGMRSYEFVMHCGWLRCHVVWFEKVVWGELEDDRVIRTTQIYSVLHSTTKYYSGTTLYYTVLLQYYSVLQSTTPVLILYYKVLLQYYSVLESTTPVLLQYYSVLQSTTLYYKVLLQYYSVLQSTTPVLRCTTNYYSSLILYYKVLLQYYSVLQSTTPVPLCTTTYYSSTSLYCKILLQYYSVLQSTTPVLLCTTKYYSSTSLYYKVLLQYYSVLHRTTPVLLCTTKYYSSTNSVLQSTTPVLLCTTQIYTSTTLYYKVLLQYYSVLQSTTPVLVLVLQSTHLQGAKHQRHQMLRLPRKVTLMIDPRHIWNVIYNAQSNRTHPPTSPNTAPATQNDSHEWCPSHMKRHLQCAEQQVSSTNVTKYCACHEKWLASLILVTRETSFTMRGTTGITLQPHQMLCLPRKMTRIIDPRDIWNVIYNARSNRHHPPTSPNTAPATQNDSHDWCPSHMTRHLQCAEQQISSSNITKCCACHAKWLASSILVTYETLFTMRGGTGITRQPHQILRLPRKMTLMIDLRHIWNVIYNARSNSHHPPPSPNTAPATQKCTPKSKRNSPRTVEASIPMRGRFDHDPTTIRTWSEHDPNMIRPWTRHLAPARSPRLLFALRRRILYWKLQHFALRLSIQISPNTAPATKTDTPRSPNTAPATQNDAHDWWHVIYNLQCAEQQISSSNITKCCACHARWLASSILVTYETLFTMRGGTGITRQPHQILRLPRKMTLMIDLRHIWNVIYNARSNRHHPPPSPNTAPATQKCTPKSKRNSPRTVEASIPMRGRFDHDPTMIRTWSDHELVISHPPVRRGYFSRFGDAFCIENYNISRSGYLSKFHRILRLPRKLTLQDHQILRLPCKMTLMIDVRHTWHVIYNARSNRSHPPTSPNAAPATQHDSHHLSSWHMKRYLQCAEEQASPANLTKYCACHAKWLSWLIFVTYETSFTMRGATGITLQPHQILRLPRKSALQNLSEILRERLKRQFQCAADSTMIRPWSDHDPTMNSSSRTRPFAEVTFRASETHFVLKITTFRAPAIYPNFTKHCACHEKWHSNITKCCACHAKLLASSILVTYATLFTMRGGTGITRQPHQILRLPRKMTLMIDLRHIWNVIYNARSNRHHPPTSPNTAPATQKCTPKSKRNSPRTVEASIPMRGRFDHDPTMIRPWSDHELVISHPPVRRGYFSRFGDAFCIENYNISRSGYLSKFHQILCLPRKVTLQDHQILRLPRKVALQDHQMLRLPRKVTLNCYLTALLLEFCLY